MILIQVALYSSLRENYIPQVEWSEIPIYRGGNY